MLDLLQALRRRLSACWHHLCGKILFRVGCVAAARRHFERVLDLGGDAFAAYVHLGRLCWCVGDYTGWRREFEHARRIDPQRFAELRHPFELFEPRTAGTTFDEAGERATWRAVRPGQQTGVRRSPTRSVELSTDAGCEPAVPPPREHGADLEHLHGDWHDSARDDCVSPAERMRLRDLGPITSAKITAADLDDLCRRLCC